MGARGRKSKADMAVINSSGVVVTKRASPPADMTPEQKSEWRFLVSRYAAEEFSAGNLVMLRAYCQHTVSLKHVNELIKQAESGDELEVKDYDRLLKMQERESRCLASLAVRLGFANTTGKHDQPKKASIKKPWEYEG